MSGASFSHGNVVVKTFGCWGVDPCTGSVRGTGQQGS